jgi:competence ComEA-like helix-hairpin-helix protein
MKKDSWKDYLSFTGKERIAITILLVIVGAFIVLPYLYAPQISKPVIDEKTQQQIAALEQGNRHETNKEDSDENNNSVVFAPSQTNTQPAQQTALFYFDPNTLDADGWKHLGLKDKTIQTILNYRSKGGQFRKPEDIRKIYGLKNEDADRLIPYVKLEPSQSSLSAKTEIKSDTSGKQNTYIKPKPSYKKIDINTATAEEWKALPGIGDVLANRIVKFRNKLHGFSSVEDIKKTYGLPDSTYQKILPLLILSDSASH